MKEKQTDSLGNPLPDSVYLTNSARGATVKELYQALTVNSTLLAMKTALRKGLHVIYDKNTKTGIITTEDGYQQIVSHE